MYTYYLTKNGKIEREGNTIYFIGEDFKKHLPVMNVSDLIISGKVSISSWALDYLSKLGIVVHFISDDYSYLSTLMPSLKNEHGEITVKQVMNYIDQKNRLFIASEMVKGIKNNIIKNIKHYEGEDLNESIKKIMNINVSSSTVEGLRGIEGNIWSIYYSTFPLIFKNIQSFERKFNPPPDPLNALISYGNAVLYSVSLTSIKLSGLNPSISFLHEPSDRSFSLALDIADIFKPVIVERTISTIVNKNIIKEDHFTFRENGCYLNDDGKKIFLEYMKNKLESTIKVKNKYFSYQNLILEEAYKLKRHIEGKDKYSSFKVEE
jgi:CRISPR-associated protein Cas1